MPRKTTEVTRSAGIWFVILIALFALGCGGEEEASTDDAQASEDSTEETKAEDNGDGEAEGEEEPKRRERTISVTVAPASRGELVVPIIAEGVVRARNASDIKFELAGILENIKVSEGQRVRKGQVIATLDGREYQMALEEARTRYLQALGQLAVEEEGVEWTHDGATLAEQMEELNRLEREGTLTRQERLDR